MAECANCRRAFTPLKYKVMRGAGRYCSKRCGYAAVTKHGETRAAERSVEYATWRRMLTRCYDTNSPDFKDYGGRGIFVCQRWRVNVEAFIADMGRRPSPSHSIDRIDTNGNYEKTNCRWATQKQQANNRRSSRRIEIGGVTRTMTEWAESAGMKVHTLKERLKRMPPAEALSKPLRVWPNGGPDYTKRAKAQRAA